MPDAPAPVSEQWMRRAACRRVDTGLFFPNSQEEVTPEAKAVCAGCPVREPCLQYAMVNDLAGIWAGTSQRQRRRLRRSRRAS